jgi:glucosamine-6-phosphate deaminase
MKCRTIISLVPYAVKAQAVYDTVTKELTPDVPATLLKQHKDYYLVLDPDSASLLPQEAIEKYR